MELHEELLERFRADHRAIASPSPDVHRGSLSVAEACRMIAKSHPAILARGGFDPVRARPDRIDWDGPQTYVEISEDTECTIAITDDGFADSVRKLPNKEKTFVKPLEERMSTRTFISRLLSAKLGSSGEILYLQSQDGNIHRSSHQSSGLEPELAAFAKYLETDIPWMNDATGHEAEAVNLWIGTRHSTTSFHHDPYENIYHVLSGTKMFTLVSPIEGLWLKQRFYPPSTLHRGPDGRLFSALDDTARLVPWVESLEAPSGVQAMTVTIRAGETLYLPADWWHKVEQLEGPGGLAVAINYWYPAEIRPERYAYERLARRIAKTGAWEVIAPADDSSDDD